MFYYYYFVWACVLCTLKREELSCRQLSIQVRNYVCSNNNQRQHQWINTKCALQNNLTHPMSKRSLPSFLAVSLSSLFSPPASTLPLVSHPEWIACENWTQDTRKTNKPITIHIHTHTHPSIFECILHIYIAITGAAVFISFVGRVLFGYVRVYVITSSNFDCVFEANKNRIWSALKWNEMVLCPRPDY